MEERPKKSFDQKVIEKISRKVVDNEQASIELQRAQRLEREAQEVIDRRRDEIAEITEEISNLTFNNLDDETGEEEIDIRLEELDQLNEEITDINQDVVVQQRVQQALRREIQNRIIAINLVLYKLEFN